jgi:hypothetical protein
LVALERGSGTAKLFFADFKKGFDLVDHNVIIKELTLLGSLPSIIRLIKAFLCDGEQCVRVGNFYVHLEENKWWLTTRYEVGSITFCCSH